MRIALIYSGDGMDVDVLYNLIRLYERLNYKVIYGNSYLPCDLIILPRPTNSTILPTSVRETPIHVYNYVGNELAIFFQTNVGVLSNCLYICTSELLIPDIVNVYTNIHTLIALPPVYPELWRKKRSHSSKYPLVHIGNLKPFARLGEDEYAANFMESLHTLQVCVWGKGWSVFPNINNRGALEVNEVSDVYAKSSVSLGLMYPSQRNTTFSGRFWHGPLNGCLTLTEPGIYTSQIPGVKNTDLSVFNIRTIVENSFSNNLDIQEESNVFWLDRTKKLEESINTYHEMHHVIYKGTMKRASYYYRRIDNCIRNYGRLSRSIIRKMKFTDVKIN